MQDRSSLKSRNDAHFAELRAQQEEDKAAADEAEKRKIDAMEPEEREAYLAEKEEKRRHSMLKTKMLKQMIGGNKTYASSGKR